MEKRFVFAYANEENAYEVNEMYYDTFDEAKNAFNEALEDVYVHTLEGTLCYAEQDGYDTFFGAFDTHSSLYGDYLALAGEMRDDIIAKFND